MHEEARLKLQILYGDNSKAVEGPGDFGVLGELELDIFLKARLMSGSGGILSAQ